MIRFLVSSSPDSLAAVDPHVTVEAEYGDRVVPGSLFTLAHHGPRKGQPAPCSYKNTDFSTLDGEDGSTTEIRVGLSHLDLDTLGGCMAVIGVKPTAPAFWHLAEFVDLYGPHKLPRWMAHAPFSKEEREAACAAIYAYWAWSQKPENRVYPPRDGSTLDVSEQVDMAASMLLAAIAGDIVYLAKGAEFKTREAMLERESFVTMSEGVVLRYSKDFCNHLYVHGDEVARACVGFNLITGAVTLSYADGVPEGMPTARELVQELWGPNAGGHDTIAGSPRDQKLPSYEADRLFVSTAMALANRKAGS